MSARNQERQTPIAMDLGSSGRLVLAGTVSTGLLLGGFVIGAMGLLGRTSGHALLPTSLGVFLAGAVIGFIVSAAFGMLGRDEGVDHRRAFRQVCMGALFAVPATLAAGVLAGWIGIAMISGYVGGIIPLASSGLAALVALGIFALSIGVTVDCGRNLMGRIRPH